MRIIALDYRYGDKKPASVLGRIYAMLWILIGLILFSVFTAVLATASNLESVQRHQVRGIKVSHQHLFRYFSLFMCPYCARVTEMPVLYFFLQPLLPIKPDYTMVEVPSIVFAKRLFHVNVQLKLNSVQS